MDKYEYKIKENEIKTLVKKGQYQKAIEIADTIDWRRVKSVMMLCMVSDLYKMSRRYEDARDLLYLAYEKRPGGRTICYSLCELLIKTDQFEEAVDYYKEFNEVAPNDTGSLILKYKLYSAQEVGLEERIAVLEELKREDYREKWAYELAYLYHMAGLTTKCIDECDEMVRWFGSGKYVTKAMELKMLHVPLTQEQQIRYETRHVVIEQQLPPETPEHAAANQDIEVKTADVSEYNTISLQAEIAEGIKEILGAEELPAGEPAAEEAAAQGIAIEDTLVNEASEGEAIIGEAFMGEASSEEILSEEPLPEEELPAQEPLSEESDMDGIILEEPVAQEELPREIDVPIEGTKIFRKEDLAKIESLAGGAQQPVAEPSQQIASVLSQESDGQIRLVIPEQESIERQITGQISIEDIWQEWERRKKEHQEQSMEQVKQRVLQHTGSMFTEFEAKVRDGLLEQIESGKIDYPGQAAAEDDLGEIEEIAEIEEVNPEDLYEETLEEAAPAEEEVPEEPAEEPTEEPSEELPEEVYEEASEEAYEEIEEESKKKSSFRKEFPPSISTTRKLTKEEQELFAPYVRSRRVSEQIANALDNISIAPFTGNLVITADEDVDSLSLAKNIAGEMQTIDSNLSGKIAKITGHTLNKKVVEEILTRLENGVLIIEKAAGMNRLTCQNLYRGLQKEHRGIVVIMIDSKKRMNQYLTDHSNLKELFNLRIDLEALSMEALAEYAKKYAKSKEYAIDNVGILAFHRRVEELQTNTHAVNFQDVREIVDEAIDQANRKTIGHFFDILLGKRYDEEDMIILKEKDFS